MMSQEKDIFKCSFTGYRPSKLPFDTRIKNKAYNDFENMIIECILELSKEGCRVFYTGMAMGFDIICAETVILLKKLYKSPLKLICAVPFEGQEKCFSYDWNKRYYNVLEQGDETVILSDRYYKGCYQKRNRFMVDNCDYVLTWFDGKSGGTKNTINYALSQNKFVINLNKACKDTYLIQESFEL